MGWACFFTTSAQKKKEEEEEEEKKKAKPVDTVYRMQTCNMFVCLLACFVLLYTELREQSGVSDPICYRAEGQVKESYDTANPS